MADFVQLTEPDNLPLDAIPSVLGELERLKAILWARLTVQPWVTAPHTKVTSDEDRLLTADQVAERLQVDRKWVYQHKEELGALLLSRKKLRFPSSEFERYLRRRKAAFTRR